MKDKDDFVQSGTPLQTCLYNRLAYIIRNSKKLKARKLMILPYLHERRIYLNRRHNSNQFYTLYNHNNQNYILCLCIADNKMYVYTETGILVDRILYKEIAEKCGKPVGISENGLNLLFKKSSTSNEVYYVEMSIKGLKLIKKIDIKESVSEYIKRLKMINDPSFERIFNYFKHYMDSLNNLKVLKLSYCLNNSGDILIRIKPKEDFMAKQIQKMKDLADFNEGEDLDELKENITHSSLFYYQANENVSNFGQYIHFDDPDDDIVFMQGVSMNEDYIFFWNLGSVWKLNLETKQTSKLSLYISEKEIQTFVKKVRCGSNKHIVVVRVE